MRTIILQSANGQDINLLLSMASRLGILYREIEEKQEIENIENSEDLENTNLLFEGLGLEETVSTISYDELEKETLPSPYVANLETAIPYFGSLEDDKNETIEELLEMLKK
ncbi:hypothetical protein V9L05_08025 [Bernardetia sp. Wsw4-3y2]|uniref:hypothetical protein n=1 Tax=Bernardetia sp. Wsw4-3y2 TaxID=3127471 RepID=UPI0030CFA1A1